MSNTRYLKRISHYGNMFAGEKHTYETILQSRDSESGEWEDVKTVKEEH